MLLNYKLRNILHWILWIFQNKKESLVSPILTYSTSILASLIPFALITGPFLPDLIISLITIIFLYNAYINRLTKYFYNPFFKIFALFCIFLIFNSLISETPLFSLKSSLVYFRFGVFSLAIWFLIDNNSNFIKIFYKGIIIGFLIAIADGSIQYFTGKNLFGYEYEIRLNLLMSDQLLLGNYLSRLFPLLLGLTLLIHKFDAKRYSIVFFLLILIDVLVFISGERTALGIMFLSNIFILLLMSKLKIFRLITIFFSVLIIILISFASPQIKERNIDLTIDQLGLNNETGTYTIFSPKHESHIISSLLMYKNNFIFGIGPNNFRLNCDKEEYNYNDNSCNTHPHHYYAQLLGETGTIGIMFILFILFYFIKSIFTHIGSIFMSRSKHLSDYQVCLYACFLCTLFPLFPSLNFFNNWINIVYYLPVGFYLHTLYSDKNSMEKLPKKNSI